MDTINNTALIKWMDKQIKEYKLGVLDKRKEDLLINEFKVISEFEENAWILSLYKIIEFYNYIKEKYNIDCYVNKIAPPKENFINLLVALYGNDKYINDESWNRGFVVNLLKSEEFNEVLNTFIDDFNIVYFQDLIDSNEEFMKRWYSYNNDNSNLEVNKLMLLSRINMDSKAS